jgi:hypothetical protein
MKNITIYKVIDRDDNLQKPSYYKGIEKLREFAIDRLYSGWDTEIEEEDLADDNVLFDFLQNDYGADVSVVSQVSSSDLKKIK